MQITSFVCYVLPPLLAIDIVTSLFQARTASKCWTYNHFYRALDGLHSKVSATSQAYMTIPRDVVRNICQEFEKLISAHRYERDSVYIYCAVRNMKGFIHQNRTYATQLRAAEDATLFNLPAYLIDFLRDHDNLYRVAFRSCGSSAALTTYGLHSMSTSSKLLVH